MRAGNNTNNGGEPIGIDAIEHSNCLTDGIPVTKELLRKILTDDEAIEGIAAIALIEFSACNDGNAESVKVIRTNDGTDTHFLPGTFDICARCNQRDVHSPWKRAAGSIAYRS